MVLSFFSLILVVTTFLNANLSGFVNFLLLDAGDLILAGLILLFSFFVTIFLL